MRILGIDPGLSTIGLGLVDAPTPHDIEVIEWLTIETAAGTSVPSRLEELYVNLHEFLEEAKPNLAVVERLFFQTNVKTAMDVAQARGVILLALAEHDIPVIEPSPLQLKSAIAGDGRADKKQMQRMLVTILKLQEIPQPDDAADALAMAVYGAIIGTKHNACHGEPVEPHTRCRPSTSSG